MKFSSIIYREQRYYMRSFPICCMHFDTPSRQVKSVQTAFQLVNVLQKYGYATPTELTEQLELSKSSIHNYLVTLERMGYVVSEGRNYRLGLRFLTHGIAAKNSLSVTTAIVPKLQSTAEELSQPMWWIAEEFGRGLFLEGSTLDDRTNSYGIIGKRSYLHTHAPGKAILAESSDEYIEQIFQYHGLPEQTEKTTTDVDTLFDEIAEIRSRGFAVSDGEAALGIISIGTGFRDSENRTHAFGVFGDSREFTDSVVEQIGTELMNAVSSLENRFQLE
jgi:IclR family transcriptional regulator, acetate operon repressor